MADSQHGLDLSRDDNKKKSRKGSIPRNVSTYLKAAQMQGFMDEMAKLSAGEDPTKMKLKHMGQAAALGAVTAPGLEVAGRFVKGVADPHGGLAGGLTELGKVTRGDLLAKSVTGALGATAIAAARDRLAQHHAREIATRQKSADVLGGAGGPPSGPSGPKVSTPAAPTLGVLRGSSNKGQRVGNTPIAAKSGVVRSASGQAMNPRANLSDAMRPKV